MKKLFIGLLVLFLVALDICIPAKSFAGISSATGGTITDNGNKKVHTFTSNGTFTPTGSGNVEILVVAGGGGGGYRHGGGGGGGGVIYNASYAVTNGTGYTVTIGGGGAGGNESEASNGSNSVFNDQTATGGGKGGSAYSGSFPAGAGGCGGGGCYNLSGAAGSQGGNGGNGLNEGNEYPGGGGGGAGPNNGQTPGAGSQYGGNGGNGYYSTISGTGTYYAGGGGGGTFSTDGNAGTGGSGGGGRGGAGSSTAGTTNTGGGGGGEGQSGGVTSGAGGSGIVIVSYTPVPAAPTNVAATDGTYTDKVTITWTKPTGATGYKVYEGSNLLTTLGDVATYDDTAAAAGSITAGSTVATDGTSTANVGLSLSGTSTSNGASRTYKVVATNAGGDSADSSTDTGYRSVGALGYQWQRSAGDSDASYSDIGGATASTYNDTGAPAGTITPGAAAATDGTSSANVGLSLSGQSVADGAGRYYKCTLTSTGASNSPASSTANRGYRTTGALTYQWQRSAADSDASYSNIDGATTASYDDTGAPASGAGRYYKCVEDATGCVQATSTADRGYRMSGGAIILINE